MSFELEDLNRPFLDERQKKEDNDGKTGPLGKTQVSQISQTSEISLEDGDPQPDFLRLASIPATSSYKVPFEGSEVSVDPRDWRHSTLLQFQVLAGFCNFVLFGLADQTIGTVIPVLESHYHIDDSYTGFIFLASTGGYFVMAAVTEACHRTLGVRGVEILGAFCMALAYLIISQRPPYIIFVVAYFIAGIGFGSLDASLNGWMGNLVDLNQLLGILHGSYGLGCMITPPLLTRLLERPTNPWMWNDYYLVLSGLAAACMVYFAVVFRHETPAKYKFMVLMNEARKRHEEKETESLLDGDERSEDLEAIESREQATASQEDVDDATGLALGDLSLGDLVPLSVALSLKLVWTFSLVMFVYVGAEAAFGSWLITFLTRIKHLSYKESSYMATTFWTGLTMGRMFLGFVTAHYFANELVANWWYIALSFLGHSVFCLVVYTSYTKILYPIVLFSGLFVGPIFPTNITSAIRVLPVKFHASGVGFICAFGGGGAAAVPFLVGLVAENSDWGLRFYPFVIALLYLVLMVVWTILRARHAFKVKLRV